MNKCRNCGENLKPDSKFCQNCGQPTSSTIVKGTSPPPQYQQQFPASQNSQYPLSPNMYQPQQQFQQPYQRRSYPMKPSDSIYETEIERPTTPLLKKEDMKIIFPLWLAIFGALFFKYLLLFDSLPKLLTLVTFFVLSGMFIASYFLWIRNGYASHGFHADFFADKFGFISTLVLTTFFVSILNVRVKTDFSKSTINDDKIILTKNFNRKKHQSQTMSKSEYFYFIVHPNTKKKLLLIYLGIGYLFHYISQNMQIEMFLAFEIFSGVLALFILFEIFPGWGRDKQLMKEIAGIQGTLIFLAAFFLFVLTMGVNVLNVLNQFR